MQKKLLGKIKELKPIHYIVIFLVAVIYIGAVIGIVNYRANRVATPPKLEIFTPIEGDTYQSENAKVEGTAAPRAKVTVNGTEVKADKDGKYTTTVPLSAGQNTVSVKVSEGKLVTEKRVTINRLEPEPVVPEVAPTPVVTAQRLNNSGPESFWLLEVGTLTAAGAAWQTSRKRLAKSFRN